MNERKCEICNEPAACWYYCNVHHVEICVEGNSPKDIREKLEQKTVPNQGENNG